MKRLAALAGALLLAAGCGGGDEAPPVPKGRFVAATRSLTPSPHLFGDPVRARIDVVVDRSRLDPDHVRVAARFSPYLPASETTFERRDFDRFTRLRYEVTIRCLRVPCTPERVDIPNLAYRDERVFRLKPAQVLYDDPRTGKIRLLKRVWWPRLEVVSRISAKDPGLTFAFRTPFRTTVTPLPGLTYRLSPVLLAALLTLAALVLLALPAVRLRRWLRGRRPPPPPEEPELTPVERAVALVEWARDRVDGEERREALEVLAVELSAVGRADLAGAARELAWSHASPSPEAADALVSAVKEPDGPRA